jgi:ABC-type Mn2+/Zn2+ transport system ATPase subunit
MPSHASKILIDADAVSVRLGNEIAIDRVSVCIHAGEFIGLIGPNGAGKTTLLRTLLGLLKPAAGTIKRQKAVYDYIPQRVNMYSGLTPLSGLEVVKLGSQGATDRARQALERVHMSDAAHKRFNDLSGGQQQRVAIAKALAAQADVLILDEPTTGIDEPSQAEFYAVLQALQQEGITIVMVSHEVEAVLKLVTRVICLNRTILYDGPPEHFEMDKYLPRLYNAQHRQLHHHHGETHA